VTILISSVTPTKNRCDSLLRTLASIRDQRPTVDEIIVVDDGSDPAVPALPGTRIIRHGMNRGACAARNSGWRASTGAFVLFVDDDVELHDKTALARATKILEAFPTCAIVAFRQLRPDASIHYMQPASAQSRCKTSQFFSYAFLARRSALVQVGGFLELLGYYFEEIELSLRLLASGHDIIYDPSLAVIHHEDERGRNIARIHRLSLRNSILTVAHDYPLWAVLMGWARSLMNAWRVSPPRTVFLMRTQAAALAEAARLLPLVVRTRKSIGTRTLLRYMKLGRWPEPC
jgi:GT2 family glycosyltransferase